MVMTSEKSLIKKTVSVSNVSKSVKNAELLSDISFNVGGGEVFGILGENGSGKTTLLRVVTGLVSPSSGTVNVAGYDPNKHPEKALDHVGALIGIPAFYGSMTAIENINLFQYSEDLSDEAIMESLKEVGLADDARKKVGVYSRGMLQRLGLAFTLLHDRDFIILDEPTQGVDEVWLDRIIELIEKRVEQGQNFIITSHNFDFIKKLCKNILILENGKQIYNGELSNLAEHSYFVRLECTQAEKALVKLQENKLVHRVVEEGGGFDITMEKSGIPQLVKSFVDADLDITECSVRSYSVTDLVLQYQKSIVN